MSDWNSISTLITIISTVVTAAGSIATAFATFFLWRVTKALAVETKRMAEASSHPQVVASIEPNRWSMRHADIRVANTGNAAAFDIRIAFDPPLMREGETAEMPVPLQKISILRPGQEMVCHLSEFHPILERKFTVSTSWVSDASASDREILRYEVDMSDYIGWGTLGSSDPLVQIAEDIRKIKEQWQQIAGGSRRLEVNSFSDTDRLKEREAFRQWYGEVSGGGRDGEDGAGGQSSPAPASGPPRGR
ncbi:MAG: hypothetical protein ABII76_26735 [Pseudomonadota bacterium]